MSIQRGCLVNPPINGGLFDGKTNHFAIENGDTYWRWENHGKSSKWEILGCHVRFLDGKYSTSNGHKNGISWAYLHIIRLGIVSPGLGQNSGGMNSLPRWGAIFGLFLHLKPSVVRSFPAGRTPPNKCIQMQHGTSKRSFPVGTAFQKPVDWFTYCFSGMSVGFLAIAGTWIWHAAKKFDKFKRIEPRVFFLAKLQYTNLNSIIWKKTRGSIERIISSHPAKQKPHTYIQWKFQDPKLEVLYHIRPYSVGTFPYIGLKNRPNIYGIGTSNQSLPEIATQLYEPWSILTIWLMVIPSIIRILIMVIINPYEPLDD